VLEEVREKIEAVIGRDGNRIAFADGERVHDDFVREVVNVVFDGAFEVLEIVRDLFGKQVETPPLHGENTGVDPVPLWRR